MISLHRTAAPSTPLARRNLEQNACLLAAQRTAALSQTEPMSDVFLVSLICRHERRNRIAYYSLSAPRSTPTISQLASCGLDKAEVRRPGLPSGAF